VQSDSDHDNDPWRLILWDVYSGRMRMELFRGEWPRALCFSPDGRTLACSFHGQIRLWEVASGRQLAIYENWIASHLVFSPHGKLLAVREDYSLCDVVDNRVLAKLAGNGEEETGFWNGSATNSILVLAKGHLVKVWDLTTATICAENIKIPIIHQLHHLTITSDRRFLIGLWGALEPGKVFVYDLETGAQKHEFRPVNSHSTLLAVAPDGKTLALGWHDAIAPPQNWFQELLSIKTHPPGSYVSLHSLPSGERVFILEECGYPVFSPDGKTLAVNGANVRNDTSLQLWDFPIRKPIGKI